MGRSSSTTRTRKDNPFIDRLIAIRFYGRFFHIIASRIHQDCLILLAGVSIFAQEKGVGCQEYIKIMMLGQGLGTGYH
jgi:hypothetical protein